jgi:CubicO group peptidase (beta-lactamase class C family)
MTSHSHAAIATLALALSAATSSATPTQAQVAPPAPTWASQLDSLIRAELARTGTPGAAIAVVVDGRLAYAQGYGIANVESGQPVTAETLFRIGSVTKMFTGTALAQLAHDGRFALDAPIGTYVHELTGRVAQVTMHQLLTHTAGWIDNAVAYGRMGEAALGEVMREVTDSMFFTEPGRTLSYSNPGFSMAGYAAEAATRERYGTLVTNTVLRPTGMQRTTFRPLEALTRPIAMGHMPGQPVSVVRPFTENTAQWPAGFLISSAPELARFTVMLMNRGTIDERRVLAPEVVERVTAGFVRMPGTPPADSTRYGYGIVSGWRGSERFWQHGGSINGYDATVVMLPDRRFSVVLLDNLTGVPLNGVVDAAMRLAIGFVPPTRETPPARDATAAERAALVGTYAMGPIRVEIVEDGGALWFRQSGVTLPLKLAGTDGLVITPPIGNELRLAFALGTSGSATYLYQGSRAFARQNQQR